MAKSRKTAVKSKSVKRTKKPARSSKTAAARSLSRKKSLRPATRKRKQKKPGIADRVSSAVKTVVDTIQETSALRDKMSERGPQNY